MNMNTYSRVVAAAHQQNHERTKNIVVEHGFVFCLLVVSSGNED